MSCLGQSDPKNQDRCSFITSLKLSKAGKADSDIYSSVTLELQLEDQAKFSEQIVDLTQEELQTFLKVKNCCNRNPLDQSQQRDFG